MKKTVFGLLVSLLSITILVPSSVFAAEHTWSVHTSPGLGSNTIIGDAASDADGSNIIVSMSFNRIFTSEDGGDTWTERQPTGSGVDGSWRVASDADGSNLIVGGGPNNARHLHTSVDGGETWTERQPDGDVNIAWSGVASDADGSNLIVGGLEYVYPTGWIGGLFTSDDGGETWTQRTPPGSFEYDSWYVASDDDGSNLIVSSTNSGKLFTSSDGGASWTARSPGGFTFGPWQVASDSDGSNLLAGRQDGRLFSSSDGGATWTERQPTGSAQNASWKVSSDADGSHLFVSMTISGVSGEVYSSDDGGETWTQELDFLDGVESVYWYSVVSDDDGTNLGAFGNGFDSRFFLAPNSGGPAVAVFYPDYVDEGASLGGNLVMTFDETVVASTGDIVIKKASDDSIVETIDVTSGAVSINENFVTINPTTTLEPETDYYVLVDAGAFEDLDENPFAGIADTTTWDFTTGTLPAVSSLAPEDDATGVTTVFGDSEIDIEFDQKVAAGTGNITLHKTSDDSVVQTFDVTDEDAVTFFEEDVYLSSVVTLENETGYYFLIDEGAIKDIVGDPFVGISDKTVWNFTTRAAATVVPDDTFVTGEGFNSQVYALAEDDSGRIVVGGYFGSYDGDDAYSIARLNTDGSLDDTFVTGDSFNDAVFALALDDDGKTLVGGGFTTYDGDAAVRIARLNTDGSLDDTFVTGDGFSSTVRALAVDAGGKILVGGSFTTYDGDTANYIARLNTDGSLDDTFVTGDGFDDTVRALAVDDDGKILVGGSFESYNGDSAYYITRLNTDGSLDDTFVPEVELNGTVYTLALNGDGDVLVGGSFEGVTPVLGEATTVTIESAGGWKDVIPGEGGAYLERPPVPEGSETGGLKSNPEGHFVFGRGSCSSETAFESEKLGNTEAGCVGSEMTGKIYNLAITSWLNGSIEEGNDPNTIYERAEYLGETGIAYLIGLSATDNSVILNPVLDGTVYALAVDADGKILVGGSFTTHDGDAAVRIARLNTDGSLDDAFITGGGFDNTVRAIVLDTDTTAVVGGEFTEYDGEDIGYIVRLTLPVDEEEEEPEEEPPAEEEEEDNSSGSSRRHTLPTQPSVPANSDDAVKTILEQLVLVLQQLIQELLAQQQN